MRRGVDEVLERGLIPVQVLREPLNQRQGLTPVLQDVLHRVRRDIGLSAEMKGRYGDAKEKIRHAATSIGVTLNVNEVERVLCELEKADKPFGILQDLIDNEKINDIIVSGYDAIAFQQGRETFSADLAFPSQEEYETFLERLLMRAGATYSTKKPIADGIIDGFARLNVVHKALCSKRGPLLTIRLNRFSEVQVNDLVRWGLAPRPLFDYLEGLVRTGHTVLVAGEVGSGKTTLVRSLAASIPSKESILVIEDTPEIELLHSHVRYMNTRDANTDGVGRVTPSECIRAGMRMAMNRIIFGEMRDAEAAESFIDVCASGHPGLSTIHARSAADALVRLELFLGRAQKGVHRSVLTEQIATAVRAVIYVDVCKVTGRRRIMEVREVGDSADGVIRQTELFRYECKDGAPSWKLTQKISKYRDALESGRNPVRLSSFPSVITLDIEQEYQEAAMRRRY